MDDTKSIKSKIIALFNSNVRGRKPDSSKSNVGHDGKDGHWLETQMGVSHNASNSPDIYGFEMKNNTSSKTTFGDWSADYYIFKDKKYGIDRNTFLSIFGAPNKQKNNRYSWSGKPCPKINIYNDFGQKLSVDENNNILVIYSFEKDRRLNKLGIVPVNMRKKDLLIAKWIAESTKLKVERKFNNRGWFKCIKNHEGTYNKIVFGNPINFDTWIDGVRKGFIFFDSGMYQGNSRNYSQWRANNTYWDSLINDEY